MNSIKVFKNEIFGEIRVIGTNETPLFCALDLCNALGYTNNRDAIAKHVDERDVVKCDTPTSSGVQTMTYVNESGLYSLIFASKLPKAKEFKYWVTNEVLPSIRKTGKYDIADKKQSLTADRIMAANWLITTLNYNEVSKLELAKAIAEPLGLPTPDYVASKGVVKSARELLTQFGAGITSQAFNKLAEAKGYLVTMQRNSSHGEKKPFKSITEKGSIYGENQVNPNNPKSTQPLWYEDKFEDLLTDLGVKIYVD